MKMYWIKHTNDFIAVLQLEGEGEFEFRIDKVKLLYNNYPDKTMNLKQGWAGTYINTRQVYTSQRLIKDLFEKIYK